MSTRTHFIYRAFDADGRLLYIGCTKRPEKRRADHERESAWMEYATRFTMAGPYPQGVALRLERAAINAEAAHFNATSEHIRTAGRRATLRRRLWAELRAQQPELFAPRPIDLSMFHEHDRSIEERIAAVYPDAMDDTWRLNRYLAIRSAA